MMQVADIPPVPLCKHKHYGDPDRLLIRIGSIPKLFKPTTEEVSTKLKFRRYVNTIISIADQRGANYKYPKKDEWLIEDQKGQTVPTANWNPSVVSGPIFVVQSPLSTIVSTSVSVGKTLLNCGGWGALPITQIQLPDEAIPYLVSENQVAVTIHFFHERISLSKKLVRVNSSRAFLLPANIGIGKISEDLGLNADENGNVLLELYPLYPESPAGQRQLNHTWRHGRKFGLSEVTTPAQAGWSAGQHLRILRSLPGRRAG
ncbi:hypothetical protein TWF281_004623 [Arthrobotrys megalospora]